MFLKTKTSFGLAVLLILVACVLRPMSVAGQTPTPTVFPAGSAAANRVTTDKAAADKVAADKLAADKAAAEKAAADKVAADKLVAAKAAAEKADAEKAAAVKLDIENNPLFVAGVDPFVDPKYK
ncbi:MAG: hypothetical protein M3R69_09725 [Acidobacteriota bacterium]|nr:hypothetical protein [Acidobacteriota bacterium]